MRRLHGIQQRSQILINWHNSARIMRGPRIPDFLSRLVALSNFMRLRESRMRGRGWCCVVGNPGNAGANLGHPCRSVTPRKAREKRAGCPEFPVRSSG
jgi:hypothetical protein